jgi:hypothetical protein
MKAMKHSAEPTKNRSSLYPPAVSQRAESAVFATLGLLGTVAIAMAVVWGSVPAGSKEESRSGLGNLPLVRYVRSGQLTADARTLAAMVHYIFESDKPVITNVFETGPQQRNLAMPTNNTCGEPKA